MTRSLIIAISLASSITAVAQPFAEGTSTPTVRAGCHATFTIADAKVLATATPNARAFVDNYGATLETAVHSQTSTVVNIAVTATDPKHGPTEVGVYTVSLKTGAITDDDMEPAEDDATAAVRSKLLVKHCAAR